MTDFSPKTQIVKDFAVNPVGYSNAGRQGRPAAGVRPGIEGIVCVADHKNYREALFLGGPSGRPPRPVDFCAILIRDRSASLTASSVENTLATSGLSSTRFVPSRYDSKYFPRTPVPRSSRLYSERSSFNSLAFFIDQPFMAFHKTRASDSCKVGKKTRNSIRFYSKKPGCQGFCCKSNMVGHLQVGRSGPPHCSIE